MAPRFRDASELGRTATSASSLTLPLPVRYLSVQKICRVCSRGSVRQDAKLPMTRGREKDVASAIVFVESSAPDASTVEGVRTRGREDVDVPPLTRANA